MLSFRFQRLGEDLHRCECPSFLQKLSDTLSWSDCRSRCWRADPRKRMDTFFETRLARKQASTQVTYESVDAFKRKMEVDMRKLIAGMKIYPLIAGEGKALFATTERRRGLELRKVQQLQDGRVSLIYGIG